MIMNDKYLLTFFSLFLLLIFAIPNSLSQSVTVNSSGGADYTSVSTAQDAVSSNAEEPNTITITGGGPYEEILIIDTPVTIRGESEEDRPIILIQRNGSVSGREDDGIANSAAVDMAFENLIFLPSVNDPPQDDGFDIRPLSDNDDFSVTLRNVLITSNNGANQPLSTDGRELMDFTGATMFGDDGFQILSTFAGIPSGTINALIENVIVTHIDQDGNVDSLGSGNDSFILGGENLTVTMRNVYVSYGDKFGFQLLSNMTANLEGTPSEPIVIDGGFGGIGSTGIRCFSGNHQWSHVTVMNTYNGIAVDSDTTESIEADHILIANTQDWGLSFIWVPPEERTFTFTFTDSTLFNNTNTLVFDPSSDSNANRLERTTVELVDSVIAGGDHDDTFLITHIPSPEPEGFTFPHVILDHTAVVQEGDHEVFFGFEDEDITRTDVLTSDPEFMSTDPANEDFLKVSADSYRTAASDGGFLSGARPFAGEVNIHHWMMF